MDKLERIFRIAFSILMFAVLWMHVGVGIDTYVPFWNLILVDAAMCLTGEFDFIFFPFLIALPTLFLLNIWLLLRPSGIAYIFYRVLVIFFVAYKWYFVIKWEIWAPFYWPFLAETIVLSVGALFEVILVLLAVLRKRP